MDELERRQMRERCEHRTAVMLNADLTFAARVLYYHLEDRAGETGAVWWHWTKLAMMMDLGHSQFFSAINELCQAGEIEAKRSRRTVHYAVTSFRKVHSGKPERSFRKTGMKPGSILSESVLESKPPYPPSGETEKPNPDCPDCGGCGEVVIRRVQRGIGYPVKQPCACQDIARSA